MHMESRPSPIHGPRMVEGPAAVIVHTTDGTFASAAAWLTDPSSGVSAHYLVGLDGRVVNLVPEERAARHAGALVEPDPLALELVGDSPNLTTIGIEFADDGDPGRVLRPDAQYEAGGELLAAVCERWNIPLDPQHVLPHRLLRSDKTCPGNLDIQRLLLEARRPLVAALLPVRNEAERLPGWLARSRAFADVVVALDDGSTDGSVEILEGDPDVAVVLRNPERPDAAGWDDAGNRQKLLDAAGTLRPRWVVQVDADERIDSEDAAALRAFLRDEALPGCAYGLRHHRAWGELVDDREVWVYRVFAWKPGLRLPAERRLHFNPVPTDIPRAAWIRTTIRFRHEGASDAASLQARLDKWSQADPEDAFEANTGGMEDVPDPTELVEWEIRDPDRPVLVDPVEQAVAGRRRTDLVVLLPVRNGADHLPGWMDGVRNLADHIIALDDGSTDETAAILAADPLVHDVLTNPRRESWAGWDEAADRQRLLDAAAELRPRFVLFLDVDERIPDDDADALRGFVTSDALPGVAYGFRVHRMVRDVPPGFDRADLWVYRLFAWAPQQRLPQAELHFVPVPETLTRKENTSIRLLHLASLTPQRRRERYDKYSELDPDRRHQPDYEHLLDEPGEIIDLQPRPEGLPVVRGEFFDAGAPVLSAIVIARDDPDRIERVVRSVVDQRAQEPFEVIVVVSGSPRTASIVSERFPEVTLVELDRPVLPGGARNAGLAVARGDYVSFPGSHVELAPGSLQARIVAHERGYPMVTGSIRNGTPTRAGWANYFLDHSTALPGRPGGELDSAPAHCSYDAGFLRDLGGFPEDLRAGEDTWVNNRLFAMGKKAWREPAIELTHVSRCDTPARLLIHHFGRGRGLGRLWFDPDLRMPIRTDPVRLALRSLPRRLNSVGTAVAFWGSGEERRRFREALPLVVAASTAAWFGMVFEGGSQALRRISWR